MIQPDHHRNYPATMLRLRKHEIPGRKFLLDVRSEKVPGLSQKIKALDGYYINSKSFEKSATHLIIDIVKCNEKFLGACVRGLWVLPPKYIEDSYQVGMWMKEEDYEHKLQNDLAGAAKRWRWKISKYEEQPFTGLHVALLLSANSEDYKRLLIFGGAQVHKLSLPLRADNNFSQISYVFTDSSYRDHVQTLTEYGLICLHYMFIVDTIIKDEELDILKYVVRKDSDTSDFLLQNISCVRGQKTAIICDISQSSQTNIQTIEVVDGINYVVDLTIDSESTTESSQIQSLKPKVSKFTSSAIVSSPCMSHNTAATVNTATKGGLSRLGNDYAQLKNLTNLCTKENALIESKDFTNPGSQRTCDDRLDVLKTNVQKSTLKEFNDPVSRQKICKGNISKSNVSSTERTQRGMSPGTVKLKSQHHMPETMKGCIRFNKESFTRTEVLSSSTKQPIQQTIIKNLERQESKRKAPSVNNSLIHISDLKYKLNPSIYLDPDNEGTSRATSKTHAAGGICQQNKDKKVVKENTDSCTKSGLKVKSINIDSQHAVINVLLQQKLHFGGKRRTGDCKGSINSCLQSLPLAQVNIQLQDCQSSVQQKPHVIIGEGLSHSDNSVEDEIVGENTGVNSQDSSVQDDIVWENTDVNSQDSSVQDDIVWENTDVNSQDSSVRADIVWENTGVNSQDSNSCTVSHSDMHTAAHVDNHSQANTKMSFKFGSSSGRHDNVDKSGNSSSRQDIEKSGNISSRKGNEKSANSSSRQDNEEKSGSAIGKQVNGNQSGNFCGSQGNKDKPGSKFDRQDSENKHRSLFNDIIYVDIDDDDDDNTRMPSKSQSTSSRQGKEDQSGSVCGSQGNENKNKNLFTEIIIVDDDDDDVANSRMPSKSESTSSRHGSEDKSGSGVRGSQGSTDKYSNPSGRHDKEDKHRSIWTDLICIDDEPSEVKKSESSCVNPPSSPTQLMNRIDPSESSPQASCPKIPSTPEMLKFSSQMDRPGLSPVDKKFPPETLFTIRKDFQPNLLRFGFSSISRTSNDSESKEGLSLSQAEMVTTSIKCIGKRKKSNGAVSETALKTSTQRGLAKRRTLDTAVSCTEFTVKGSPEWASSNREEEPSMAVESTQSNACGTASVSSAANGYIKTSNPSSVQLQSSNTELPHQTTQRGLAKRRLETVLSHTETNIDECPSVSREKEFSMAVESTQSNVSGYITMNNSSLQSSNAELPHQTTQRGLAKRRALETVFSHTETNIDECSQCPSVSREKESSMGVESTQSNVSGYITMNNSSLQTSNAELPHLTTYTQRGLAKRRAVDDSDVLSESKVPKTSRSASSDSVTLPRVSKAGLDGSIHSSDTKSPCVQIKKSLCKSLSWSIKLANQTTHTQRGLTKKKASFPQIQDTNQSNSSWCPAGRRDQNANCTTSNGVQCVTHNDSESECDSSTNDLQAKMIHPPSPVSSSCGQTAEGSEYQSPINGSVVRSGVDGNESRQLRTEECIDSSRPVTDTRMAADSLHAVISETEAVAEVKFSNLQNSSQENGNIERSLFESFYKLFSDIKTEISNSDDNNFKGILKDEPGPSSELTASTDVHMISTVSKTSGDIEERNLFKQVVVPVHTATTAYSEDSMDLPTPPSVICHDSDVEAAEAPTAVSTTSEAVVGELSSDFNPSIVNECVIEEGVQQQAQVQRQICNNKHMEPSTSAQSSESYPLWPLTYPLSYNTDAPESHPFLPVIYGQWMESSRDMGFFEQAIAHGKPTKNRLPTSLLLSELVQLARCTDGDVCPQAINYLYSWLELHPPLTPVAVRLYTEAFELSSENSVIFEILRDVKDDSKQSSAILLLEYFITVFEINFDFSLKSGGKSLLQKCLIVKWLWKNSYTIALGKTIPCLLEMFEYIIRAPLLNCRACNAACAFLSLSCECLRLANIQWDHHNSKFIIDSVITLSHDIAKRIHSCIKTGNKARNIVLDMLRPSWLRILVAAKLLSYYNNYLLSDPIHANNISMNSIVSQFFLLVPLESSGNSDAQDHVESNHPTGYTSKLSESALDATKAKEQKGVLTAEKVNKRNGKGESAIHIACMRNRAEDLRKLLEVPGADVNLRDNNGWTPLHEACHHGHVACVELLLKYVPRVPGGASANQGQTSSKVEIDAQGPDGLSPLHDAVCNNKIDVCKLLLKYGGKKLLKTKTHYNLTALDLAKSDEMQAVLNGSSEESSLFDLSISQDLDDPTMISDAVKDIAPLAQRYTEITGTDCSHLTSRSSCEEFLKLLTVLVSSYYNILGSLEKSHQLDPKEKDVLKNMNKYLRLFRRHLRKLTRPEDFEKIQFRLECFESLCMYKPGSMYL